MEKLGFPVRLTFDGEINRAAFLPCIINDLTGVLSGVRSVHVEKLQNNLVVLQGEITALSSQDLLCSSEPLQLERGAALHHGREGHVGAWHGVHRLRQNHEGWRFWVRTGRSAKVLNSGVAFLVFHSFI